MTVDQTGGVLEVLSLAEADRLPERPGLATVDADITLSDQMVAAARTAGLAQPEPVADFAIDTFDAEALLDRVPRPMSRGERQLCALLITLAAPVRSMALVDPTAGLDGRRRRAVARLLVDLAADRAVAVATDDPAFDVHRPWSPLPLGEVRAQFDRAPMRWWIAGGHALELHLGQSWRSHADTDVGIARGEASALRGAFDGWDIQVAAAGVLSPWDGRALDPQRSENNLWCRPTPASRWRLDVLVGEGTDSEWIYRRDPAVRRPWPEAVLTSADGTPYLAPELQLLFKSKTPRPKDDVDAEFVLPRLEPARVTWLAAQLADAHPWHALL